LTDPAGIQTLSTWRQYLGGNQYNTVFSHFLAVHLSRGANAWIWKKGPHNQVLRSLAEGLGDAQTRHLIMEYRARQAMVDFGPWTDALKVPITSTWGLTITSEPAAGGVQRATSHKLTPYVATPQSGTTLTPAPATLPGWTGANQVPLKVSGNKVRVKFNPLSSTGMRFQLAYRAQDGSAVYSQPVSGGEACLDLSRAPKSGVVIGVVSNTDYIYGGEATRKAKYDYRLELLEGVTGTASLLDKHYE
jgi:hypothetical protein